RRRAENHHCDVVRHYFDTQVFVTARPAPDPTSLRGYSDSVGILRHEFDSALAQAVREFSRLERV
ncbi:MAG TPA: hypothetical protein VJR26_13190, partial [Candidatus Acidoferrales bacterium]|nr:hypothetical protein [Candidatus Acidoferrales bacterium]